jgi:hypothetical protein
LEDIEENKSESNKTKEDGNKIEFTNVTFNRTP